MLGQPRNYPTQVHREKLGVELGKMPFYGQPENCAKAHYLRKRNRS